MTGYGECATCGNPLNDGEMFRGELCEACDAEWKRDWRAAGDSVYCASVPALRAAAGAYPGNDADKLAGALIAAHHPDLGLDRSVCLRDVYDLLEAHYHPQNPSSAHPADTVSKHFARVEWLPENLR